MPLFKTELTLAEQYSLRNTMKVLAGHDRFVIAPERLEGALHDFRKVVRLEFQTKYYSDKYFESIQGYNALMMSKSFYQSFAPYDYILIVQTDALVFADKLDDWCSEGYSYVGAPWISPGTPYEGGLQFAGVGNGGLSLRRVQDFVDFLSVLRRVKNITLPGYFSGVHGLSYWVRRYAHELLFSYNFPPFMPRVNEDVFWGLLAPRCEAKFSVPTPEQAMSFAFEAAPEQLYELNQHQLPFGCHAWERYGAEFWRGLLAGHGMLLP